MSKKRTKYTSASKTKLVLELLQNESTLVHSSVGYYWVLTEVDCMTSQGQTTLSKPSKITAHKCLNKYPPMVKRKSISN